MWMVIGMDSKVVIVRSIFVRKMDLFLRLLVCNVEISLTIFMTQQVLICSNVLCFKIVNLIFYKSIGMS